MDDQKSVENKGGTMRLGKYPCKLKPGTITERLYHDRAENGIIYERHRHRYEVNNFYRERLEEAGLIISGTSPDDHLVEIVEHRDHPYLVACQFHPEFKSRPDRPHPLFMGLIEATVKQKNNSRTAVQSSSLN